jgi:hypothetical protein
MIQDQLVEYIDAQLKAGIPAETLKTTLVGAGWQAVDVDDTMKKVQAPQSAQTSTLASAAPSIAQVAAQAKTQAPVQPTIQPQVIRVSDLVSTSSASPMKVNPMSAGVAKPMQVSSAKTDAVMTRIASSAAGGSNVAVAASGKKNFHAIETETILGILMVACGVAAAFFFFQNRNLSGQIATLNGTSGTATSQLATLQSQLTASTTALEAELSSSNAMNDALALNLAFSVVPPGTKATTTFTTALTGTVTGGGKYSYVITTPYGVKVSVVNSKDAQVISLLQPLVGTTSTMTQFEGNYLPGVASITLTAVNGVSTTPPPVVATSTATSSAASPANGLMIPATSTTP